MTRYARKRDISEKGIVDSLKLIGCDVERGTDCDLYVRCPKGYGYMMEIKTPGPAAKRRQPIQKRLAEIFGDAYKVVTNSREALVAIGYYTEQV